MKIGVRTAKLAARDLLVTKEGALEAQNHAGWERLI